MLHACVCLQITKVYANEVSNSSKTFATLEFIIVAVKGGESAKPDTKLMSS